MAFELRRGDEDSAPVDKLSYNITVIKIVGDELHFEIHFEKPYLISIGLNPDVLVLEITNSDFFS